MLAIYNAVEFYAFVLSAFVLQNHHNSVKFQMTLVYENICDNANSAFRFQIQMETNTLIDLTSFIQWGNV